MKKIILTVKSSSLNPVSFLAQGFMLVLFLLVFNQDASAQSTATGGVLPPKSEVRAAASALGITVYDFNSWNLNVVKDVLRLKMDQTTGTDPVSVYKKAYYGIVLDHMGFDIAPQIATVLDLNVARTKVNHSTITDDIARSVYNDLVSSF